MANLINWRVILSAVFVCLIGNTFGVMAQNPPQTIDLPRPVINRKDDGNKITIRNAPRITATTCRTIIEIEVHSDVPFQGGNDTHVLSIGSKRFAWPRGGDASSNTLIFELTPEQFSKVKSGDEVKVTYGLDEESSDQVSASRRIWKFGKLDKAKIDK